MADYPVLDGAGATIISDHTHDVYGDYPVLDGAGATVVERGYADWRFDSGLIDNGGFETDPTVEWQRNDATVQRELDLGRLKMTLTGAGAYVWQSFATEPGVQYTVTADVVFGTNLTGASLQAVDGANGTFIAQTSTATADGPLSLTFTAASATSTVRLRGAKTTTPAVAYFDNAKVEAAA